MAKNVLVQLLNLDDTVREKRFGRMWSRNFKRRGMMWFPISLGGRNNKFDSYIMALPQMYITT